MPSKPNGSCCMDDIGSIPKAYERCCGSHSGGQWRDELGSANGISYVAGWPRIQSEARWRLPTLCAVAISDVRSERSQGPKGQRNRAAWPSSRAGAQRWAKRARTMRHLPPTRLPAAQLNWRCLPIPKIIPMPLSQLRAPFDRPDCLFEVEYQGFRAGT